MNLGNRALSWATLEELHAQGKLKAIGVSNYTPAHMRELIQSCKVCPAVLQVSYAGEMSDKRQIIRYKCKEYHIYNSVLGISVQKVCMFYSSGGVSPTTVPDRAEECL